MKQIEDEKVKNFDEIRDEEVKNPVFQSESLGIDKSEIIYDECPPCQIFVDKSLQTCELFAGTQSFSKVAREFGHRTFTVELNDYFEADLHKNILDVRRKDLPKHIDVLWASPPCTSFSVASIGSSWCGKVDGKPMYHPKRSQTALGMAFILKTLELIKEIMKDNPNLIWFIENPRGVLRKMAFMHDLHRNTITYCQYGDNRMKPTDIWTNLRSWIPKPMCKNGMPCHVAAPRGSKTGTQGLKGNMERSVIPPQIFQEIFPIINNEIFK